jgi:pimeloyl-ACP methyl ester carboxylesterase
MAMRLALHTWGSVNAGKTALLIHGVMGSYGTWVRVAHELAERGYYVIAPDLRGHGESAHADSYTTDDFAADLVESLPKDVDVAIGHSLGGRSLLLAVDALAPARAVYSDPSWIRSGATKVIVLMRAFAPATKVVTEAQIQRINPRWSAEDVAAELASYQRWDPLVMEAVADYEDMDVPAATIPSLVQAADPSYAISAPYAEHLTALGYTVRVVPGTGHVIHCDDLPAFMASLDGWI